MSPSPCPQCGSTRVHRPHRRGFTERVLPLLGLKLRRCHSCNLRFARLGSSVIFMPDAERFVRTLAFLGLIVAGAVLILALMAWVSAWPVVFPLAG